jgi:hypothetical protein
MRNRIGISLGLALVTLLATAVVAAADDTPRRVHSSGTSKMLRAVPFTATGSYSGAVGGEIRLDGVGYRISPNACLYELDRGEVPLGTVVQDRVMFLTGLKTANCMVVYSVILRPESEAGLDVTGPSTSIRIHDESAPR